MSESGYICAGFETLSCIVDNFIKNKKGRFENNFSREDISDFLCQTSSGFLHSYGQNFTNKKSYTNYNKNEGNLFKKCRETGLFNKSNFIVDSGGFQASIGKINKHETKTLIDLYYKFLEEYVDVYDRAFILDLPPGPGCVLFENFNDVYNLNLETYTKALSLPKNIRDKIIYIHHFRTPKIWDIYTKILKENDMFDKFNYHGTGGIVANMSSDVTIPCIIYVIPIVPLLKEAIRFKKKVLNFHILGGANFRDILFYEMFTIHVKKKHDIQLNITYDSSGLFKGLMVGRYLPVLKDGEITKIDLRTSRLNEIKKGKRVIDIYADCINEMSDKFNFKRIDMSKIYSEDTGTFYPDICAYSLLYMLYLYYKVQKFLKDKSKLIYELVENNDLNYSFELSNLTRDINNGKITKKQSFKSNSLMKSLNVLEDLNEDYCKKIIGEYLVNDEFIKLTNSKLINEEIPRN